MVERYKSKLSVIADGGFGYSIPIVRGGELRSRDGDKVRAALMYDQHERKLYCRVLSIYGKANSAKICADAIIDRYGIPSEFSKGLRAEAKRVSEEPITAEEIAKRRDLRDEAILTIDSADAKDLDDAISVKKTEMAGHSAYISPMFRIISEKVVSLIRKLLSVELPYILQIELFQCFQRSFQMAVVHLIAEQIN